MSKSPVNVFKHECQPSSEIAQTLHFWGSTMKENKKQKKTNTTTHWMPKMKLSKMGLGPSHHTDSFLYGALLCIVARRDQEISQYH